jgi:phosphoribosyl 1,2-cyclic phosphodiesterase
MSPKPDSAGSMVAPRAAHHACPQFTVLASGSGGNASLLEVDGFGLLLDAGLGPRQLAGRLRSVGASWQHVHAVLLTHTHGDHWKDRTLAHLERLGIPLYCHPEHHDMLAENSSAFADLQAAALVRDYEPEVPVRLGKMSCRPFRLCHDGGLTCGFRLEGQASSGRPFAIAYAADLGSWGPDLARHLLDVDLLALEFNHDVALERASGRAPQLIARVLGDHGHLSNVQAAALVAHILSQSAPGRLRHLVQLHLSRDCNRPALARQALGELAEILEVHTAGQHRPGPRLPVGTAPRRTAPCSSSRAPGWSQALLPGWEA